MVSKKDERLIGMKAICDFLGRSETTVLDYIRTKAFPAEKVAGGIWEAEVLEVRQWRGDRLETEKKPAKKKRTTPKNSGDGNKKAEKPKEEVKIEEISGEEETRVTGEFSPSK